MFTVGCDHALQLRQVSVLRPQIERRYIKDRVLDRDHKQVRTAYHPHLRAWLYRQAKGSHSWGHHRYHPAECISPCWRHSCGGGYTSHHQSAKAMAVVETPTAPENVAALQIIASGPLGANAATGHSAATSPN